jgi:hypothetical protein
VLLCFGAGYLLFRNDSTEYRRQWIASGRSARSWYVHVARRIAVSWLVIGALWVFFFATPIGRPVIDALGAFVQRLSR